MARREKVHDCAYHDCNAYLVEGRGDPLGWQEIRARPMQSKMRATAVSLCPEHALRLELSDG